VWGTQEWREAPQAARKFKSRRVEEKNAGTETGAPGLGLGGGGLEMGVEEGEGALASDGGGVRFEVGTLVAVEAVTGIFVKEDGKAGVSLLDFLDF
jgi:hypothetical protein